MKPYSTIRFTELPDCEELFSEGRKSSVGTLKRGEISHRLVGSIVRHADGTPGREITKVVHNDHGSIRSSKQKAKIRRSLKRADKARIMRELEAA